MRKFNFLDDEKVKREKGKIEAGHRTSPLHKTFFLRIFIQMFLLVYSTIKIRDAQRLPLHLQPRKDQLKSFQYRLRRLQSQLVILPCKNAGRKKKIRLWSTLFSSSTPKMIHVIEKKILPPSEERSTEKENFWLNDDTHGLFSSRKTSRLQKNEAPRSNANFRFQDPTRFSVQEQSSLNTRIVDSGI